MAPGVQAFVEVVLPPPTLIVIGGVPWLAIRRSTSTPANTLRQPSSQPPLGTLSMWPPISNSFFACFPAPFRVNHKLPASSISWVTPGMANTFSLNHARLLAQMSVHATRWAPFASPVRARSSFSSSTVRLGLSASDMRGIVGREAGGVKRTIPPCTK